MQLDALRASAATYRRLRGSALPSGELLEDYERESLAGARHLTPTGTGIVVGELLRRFHPLVQM